MVAFVLKDCTKEIAFLCVLNRWCCKTIGKILGFLKPALFIIQGSYTKFFRFVSACLELNNESKSCSLSSPTGSRIAILSSVGKVVRKSKNLVMVSSQAPVSIGLPLRDSSF